MSIRNKDSKSEVNIRNKRMVKTLAENLKSLMRLHPKLYSQSQLARKIGVSQPVISRWIHGESTNLPRMDQIQAIADLYFSSVSYLFTDHRIQSKKKQHASSYTYAEALLFLLQTSLEFKVEISFDKESDPILRYLYSEYIHASQRVQKHKLSRSVFDKWEEKLETDFNMQMLGPFDKDTWNYISAQCRHVSEYETYLCMANYIHKNISDVKDYIEERERERESTWFENEYKYPPDDPEPEDEAYFDPENQPESTYGICREDEADVDTENAAESDPADWPESDPADWPESDPADWPEPDWLPF